MEEVRSALGGISEWFDEYMSTEESDSTQVSHSLFALLGFALLSFHFIS